MVFKAYDIRGIYNKDLDTKSAYIIGRSITKFLNAKLIVVGRDCRLSSAELFTAICEGITDQGADVIDIGDSSTDLLNFIVAQFKFPAGIMITASHNPKEYNGFKIVKEDAIPVGEDSGLKEIEKIYRENKFIKDQFEKGKITNKIYTQEFIRHIFNFVELPKFRKLKVVVDGSNGTAGLFIHEIFNFLPCELIPLNLIPDGNFPSHEPNPMLERNRRELSESVVANQADIGIAFDGDCDRCFFVDSNGGFIPGDFVTAIFAEHFLKKQPNKILFDVRSSWAVKDTIIKNNGIPIEYKVGHAFMKMRMRNEDAVFGGEVSGHYYYRDNHYCDSGFISMLIMLQIVSISTLNKILTQFNKYNISGEINFRANNKDSIIKIIKEKYHGGTIQDIDGVSILFPDWHFNIRKSNTEPLLRLNVESKSKLQLKKKLNELSMIIESEAK